ncbi:hypothetical protein [Polymorphobacter fuscus]|uniref:Uncharacterized protein n=1 Tax=Sandarakinorhabdus fusca TaxID=1439888 RepID=A0A7C9KJK3_9SPHN|nr:hypothetical protein [Polymorphobacter fuscus]KAB7644860.1 hypothetical protein F9290_12825 [Polymorphobacter fuscus]MQT18139.1 hypothetical protein [Polymorphobacter fuscus]NJC09457.1 hypothetical protein [Polymorphobacter fuscus]
MTRLFARESWETGCTIAVEHTADALHAHVELDDNVLLGPGDQVRVHGSPVRLPFGEAITLRRRATVSRAGLVMQWWTKLRAQFDLTELYEITFTSEKPR